PAEVVVVEVEPLDLVADVDVVLVLHQRGADAAADVETVRGGGSGTRCEGEQGGRCQCGEVRVTRFHRRHPCYCDWATIPARTGAGIDDQQPPWRPGAPPSGALSC